MLFSRQLLNGSQDFFCFNILIYFLKYETIETHARPFLTLNILAIGRVVYELYYCVTLNILTFRRPCCVSLCEANFSSRYIDTSWLNLACSLSVTASSFIMSLHSVTCCICIHLTPIYHITLYIHIT